MARRKGAAGRRSGRGGSRAREADLYTLYEKSVQDPDADIALINRVFRKQNGRAPRLLREDFCGTAIMACRWVERNGENRAWAIDIDPAPLDWARKRHVPRLSPERAGRLELIEGDVLEVKHARVDVTVAFNFSYFLFRTRDQLRRYFARARATLLDDGILFLDAYGGADSQRVTREKRRVDGFDYVWDQHSFDPISHTVTNFIHFEFKDGSRLRRAFRYDWRLWTLPEIRELLREAGFRSSAVYWEGTDRETGEANGIFTQRERAPDDPAWVAYIAAAR